MTGRKRSFSNTSSSIVGPCTRGDIKGGHCRQVESMRSFALGECVWVLQFC